MRKLFAVISILIPGLLFYYFFPEKTLPGNVKVDRIVVIKSKRIMEVYSGETLLKKYKVSLGRNPAGDKEFEGDKRTPEGEYYINGKNDKSGYHKNLGVSYPNHADVREARKKNLRPGGDIKIHGLRNGLGIIGKFQRWKDWTAGCIAVTDEEMDELFESVGIGTPIVIRP